MLQKVRYMLCQKYIQNVRYMLCQKYITVRYNLNSFSFHFHQYFNQDKINCFKVL